METEALKGGGPSQALPSHLCLCGCLPAPAPPCLLGLSAERASSLSAKLLAPRGLGVWVWGEPSLRVTAPCASSQMRGHATTSEPKTEWGKGKEKGRGLTVPLLNEELQNDLRTWAEKVLGDGVCVWVHIPNPTGWGWNQGENGSFLEMISPEGP